MSNVIEFLITAKDKFSKPMGAMRGALNGVGKALFSIKGLIAGAGIGLLARQFLQAGSTTENLKVRLNALLGSVQEGNRLFKEMTEFAGQVPFEYEEIMESATSLSGVLKGGVDEIKEWMPIIGDLAAVSGLSIQKTTEQVQRMLSAGAASADLFRERGVSAMIGFQSGVSYSVDETRKKLLEAWESPISKFRGATKNLATTWTGIMSMISDKWFGIRTTIMDSGVMDFIKAVGMTIDQYMGDALKYTKDNAEQMGRGIVDWGFAIIDTIGFVADVFRGLHVVIKGLWLTFQGLAAGFLEGWNLVAKGWIALQQLLNEDYEPPLALQALNDAANKATAALIQTKGEFDELIMRPMPSENVAQFKEQVEANLLSIQETAKATQQELAKVSPFGGSGQYASAEEQTILEQNAEKNKQALEDDRETLANHIIALQDSFLTESELQQMKYENDLLALQDAHMMELIEDETFYGFKRQLEDQYLQEREGAFKGSHKAVFDFMRSLRQADVSDALQAGQMMLQGMSQQSKTAFRIQKAAGIAQAIVNTYKGVSMSLGQYPMPVAAIMAGLHLAVGMANISKIKSAKFQGQAHAGLTNVPREGTYLLNRGERVIAPAQNRDLGTFLKQQGEGEGGGGSVTIQNMSIHMFENVTDASALLRMDPKDVEEVVAVKLIPAFNILAKKGIRPQDLERVET